MRKFHDDAATPVDLIGFASLWATKAFRRDGEIHPIWHAITRDGEHLILPTPWGAPGERDHQTTAIRVLFELKDVVRYVMLHECWMARFDDVPDDAAAAALREELNRDGVQDRPDRIEIVMFQAEVAGQIARTAYRRIVRPPRGRAYLNPLEWFPDAAPGAYAVGRMVGMLPVRGAMQ